ncbi:uncharacterized protein MONBRDRAFT_3751, partial [Monosiga brevicollis MX1]
TRSEDLREEFSKFGPIKDVYLPVDRESQRPRGFGFVTFEEQRSADDAIAQLNEQDFMGRRIQVNFARARGAPRGGGG